MKTEQTYFITNAKLQLIYFLLAVVLPGCVNEKKENKQLNEKRSELKEALIGQWGSPVKDRPTFDITEDSIYHFGNKKSFPYKLENNTMVITENGIKSKYYKVQVIGNDTLLFESPPGSEIAAIRFKEYYPH